MQVPEITPETARALVGYAGLEVSPEEAERLAGVLRSFFRRLRLLEGVDLEGVEPAYILPPRWP